MTRCTNGRKFLALLADYPQTKFENQFASFSNRLGLGRVLTEIELRRLFEATFHARLCNIAFNGLGGCQGQIKPDREANRSRLEREFLEARDEFFAADGWSKLSELQRDLIQKTFLNVAVFEHNLAK